MAAYIGGGGAAHLAQNRPFFCGYPCAVVCCGFSDIIGLNIGKWLQNAGGVGTTLPLVILVGVAMFLWHLHGSATHFTLAAMLPHWDWGTVNFWPQFGVCFTGLEFGLGHERRNQKPAADDVARNSRVPGWPFAAI